MKIARTAIAVRSESSFPSATGARSKNVRSPWPIRLKPSTALANAAAGTSAIQAALKISKRPCARIAPHSVVAKMNSLPPPRSGDVVRDGLPAAHDDAEESELAEHEEDRARLERRRDREHRQQVRQHVAREHREFREAHRARGLEERPPAKRDDGGARRPAEPPPARDRERRGERAHARADVEREDPEHREEDGRERAERIDERRHRAVERRAREPSRERAERRPDDEPHGENDERDRECRARSVEDARPEVAARAIGAERIAVRARVVRREHRARSVDDERRALERVGVRDAAARRRRGRSSRRRSARRRPAAR